MSQAIQVSYCHKDINIIIIYDFFACVYSFLYLNFLEMRSKDMQELSGYLDSLKNPQNILTKTRLVSMIKKK